MRTIFMGTPDYAAESLRALLNAGVEITLVVTQPDRRKGRGQQVSEPPVKVLAKEWNIPVFQPVKVKEKEAVERLRAEKPDLIIVAAFGQILSQEILDIPAYGCVNVHASILPKYRGSSPIQWAVINGEATTGVTIMQMDRGIDTGDILMQEEIELDPKETADSLYDKLSVLGGKLMVRALPYIKERKLSPIPQRDEAATYCKMLRREMGEINWNCSAAAIERLIRGMNSWPGAYTHFRGKSLKIWDADVVNERAKGDPGTLFLKPGDKEHLYVNTKEGVLSLNEIQMEGKKRLKVKEFLLGAPIQQGDAFTYVH